MASTINETLIDQFYSISSLIKHKSLFSQAAMELTLQQIHALSFIQKNKSVAMHQIADYFQITLPTATILVDKLIAQKLVTRVHDTSDRRIVRIALSSHGVTLLEKAKKIRNKKVNLLLSHLSLSEKKTLLTIFKILHNRMEVEIETKQS